MVHGQSTFSTNAAMNYRALSLLLSCGTNTVQYSSQNTLVLCVCNCVYVHAQYSCIYAQ
jgi:hypothetical protein